MTNPPSPKTTKDRYVNYSAVAILVLAAGVILVTAGVGVLYVIDSLQDDNSKTTTTESRLAGRPDVAIAAAESVPLSWPERPAKPDLPTVTPTENPLQPKPIRQGSSSRRHIWTPTPLPSPTAMPTPSPFPTFVGTWAGNRSLQPLGLAPNERWIDVNLTEQKLVAYVGQLPVFDSMISSGMARYPTVTGQFRVWLRFQSQDMNGRRLGYDYYLQDVPYVQYFYQDYALHGTFWHNNFGTPMSHGCVNLPTPAAEWLYNWADYGTLVNIHY